MIGERLADVRKDHGDTQAALADRLKVSLSSIRSWEQEKSSPPHELLVSICKYMRSPRITSSAFQMWTRPMSSADGWSPFLARNWRS